MNTPASTSLRNLLPDALLLTMLCALLCAPWLFTGRILLARDLFLDFIPMNVFLRDALAAGEFPLWNPYTGCGEAYVGEPEASLFYPLAYPFLLLPPGIAEGWSIFLHLCIAGWGTLVLARQIPLSRPASLLAAISFSGGECLMLKMEFLPGVYACAWFPLVVAVYWRWLRSRRGILLLLLALLLALQFLAGWPEAVFFTVLSLVLLGLTMGSHDRPKERRVRAIAMPLLGLGAAGATALSLGAVLLLPVAEAVLHSTRTERALNDAIGTFDLPMLIGLVFPSIYGAPGHFGRYWAPGAFEYWVGALYLGIIPILLCCACIAGWMRGRSRIHEKMEIPSPWTRYFLLLLCLSLLYALGNHTLFFPLLKQALPIIGMFRWPAKALMCAALALSMLGGLAWDAYFRTAARNSAVRNTPLLLGALLALVAAVCSLNDAALGRLVLERGFNLAAVPEAYAGRIPWDVLGRDALRLAVIAPLAGGLLALAAGGMRRRGLLVGAVLALALADLGVSRLYFTRTAPADILASDGPAHRMLRDRSQDARFLGFSTGTFMYGEPNDPMLNPIRNLGSGAWPMADGMRRMNPAGSFEIQWMDAFLGIAAGDEVPERARSQALALASCTTTTYLPDPVSYYETGQLEQARVVPRGPAWPRIRVVGGLDVRASQQEVLRALAAEQLEAGAVLIARDDLQNFAADSLSPGMPEFTIADTLETLASMHTTVTTPSPALLVLSDTWYPGWHATVNDASVPVLRVNGAFRGIPLSAGENRVKVEFRPLAFHLGLSISVLSWSVLLAWLLRLAWKAAR